MKTLSIRITYKALTEDSTLETREMLFDADSYKTTRYKDGRVSLRDKDKKLLIKNDDITKIVVTLIDEPETIDDVEISGEVL